MAKVTNVREPEGGEFMECPRCGAEGFAKYGENLCGQCGTWFEVEPDDDT